MREADLVTKIIQKVRALCPRAYIRKLSDRFNRGLPDILVVAPRSNGSYCTVFVECKTLKGKLAAIQERELDLIRKTGAYALVARDVECVVNTLTYLGCVSRVTLPA